MSGVTLERLECALDSVALMMEHDFGTYGNDGLIALYERLTEEVGRLRAAIDVRSRARERARRLKDQKAARSAASL